LKETRDKRVVETALDECPEYRVASTFLGKGAEVTLLKKQGIGLRIYENEKKRAQAF
jgi:hypothetical protein